LFNGKVLIQTPQSNNAIAMDAYSHYVYIAGNLNQKKGGK